MPEDTMTQELPEGWQYLPEYVDARAQTALVEELRELVNQAPFFKPVMPRSGKPFSVEMTNFGKLGWVSDKQGYRYQPCHPDTGKPWPGIPETILALWREVSAYPHDPEACLVNFYLGRARMGLHRDADEDELAAPVVSISLGDSAVFRIGNRERRGPTRSLHLNSGDVMVMGGAARLCYHGIDRILAGTSPLLKHGGRLNLTLRRISIPAR